MDLQTKFTELKNRIDDNKLAKARLETSLEQSQKQLDEANKALQELVGTVDENELQDLVKQLETKIKDLSNEAEKILSEAGL